MEKIKTSTILVVDDSITIRKIICANLQKIGVVKFFQAKDGDEAFRIAAAEKIDIVITDHNMTGMNGLKLVSRLKSNPKTEDVFVIAMSSEFNDDLKAEYGFFGVSQFIHKPFNLDTFINALSAYANKGATKGWDRPSPQELESLISEGNISAHKDGEQIVFTFANDIKLFLKFSVMLDHSKMYKMFELD